MKLKIKFFNIDIRKTVKAVIALNVLEIIIVIGITFYNYLHDNLLFNKVGVYNPAIILYIVVLIIIINSFLTIRYASTFSYSKARNDSFNNTIIQLENLNKTLRAQRHDFMNHLQVVYSLMEMEDYTESMDYIDKVYKDIQKVNKFLKTSNPAVNALLQAKTIFAEKKGIKVKLDIKTQLNDLKIASWEFCRVLGNLLDNSIYVLENKNGERKITIELYEDLKMYGFRIENNGTQIPKEICEKIFEVGFTTKGEDGQGMGLAISKEILLEAGGNIRVYSNNDTTYFEGFIPK